MIKKYKKEILKVGKWLHPNAPKGVLEVTKDLLTRLVENYKVTPFVPVLRGHVSNLEAEKNPALILNKNIENLTVEGDKLYAEMNIEEKELDKYNDVSVSIDPEYVEKTSGKNIGATLRHVAAVINPYIKGMDGFTLLSENDKNYLINLSEITDMAKKVEADIKLEESKIEEVVEETKVEEAKAEEPAISEESKEETKVEETEEPKLEETKVEEVTEETAEVDSEDSEKTEVVEASEDVETQIKKLQQELAQAKLELSSREASDTYNILLSEAKILPSQKETFMLLHENLKGTIDLAEGTVSMTNLLVDLLKMNPKLVNLEETGINEVSAEISEEDKIKAELRSLPVHAKESDEEFATWWNKYGAKIVAEYNKEQPK